MSREIHLPILLSRNVFSSHSCTQTKSIFAAVVRVRSAITRPSISISEIENTRLVDGELLVVFCVSASILFARSFDTFAHMRSSLVERTIMQYQLDVRVLRTAFIISMHRSRSDHLFVKWLLTVLSIKPAVSEAPDTRITAARIRHLADRYRTNQTTSRAAS